MSRSLAALRLLFFTLGFLSVIQLPTAAAPAGAETTHSAPSSSVFLNGYPVNPTRILVRWKSGIDAMSSRIRIEAALRSPEATLSSSNHPSITAHEFSNLKNIGFVEFKEGRSLSANAQMDGSQPPKTTPPPSPDSLGTALILKSRIAALRATGLFEYVEPDYIQQLYSTPSDAAFADGRLWALENTGQNGGVAGIDIQASDAWEVTTGSEDVIVGVIDSGIRYNHPDLAGNMWNNPGEVPGNGVDDDGNGVVDDVFGFNAIDRSGNPLDVFGHGTHCAGTIGATANDLGEHVGVAQQVRLMALQFVDESGSGANSDALACIDYAIANGAHILNGSYGGGGPTNAMIDAIERAREAGILIVFAAGNVAANNDEIPDYPSGYPNRNILAVASIDRNGDLAASSNYGASTVDIAAPGVEIFSCDIPERSDYSTRSGTSMATPHVTGVAALLKARYPNENYQQLKDRLISSARPLPSLEGKVVAGGFVQARAALDKVADGKIELTAATDPFPLHAGEPAIIVVRLSDLGPLVGATAVGTLGTIPLVFRDDGIAPDSRADDGTYTTRVGVPETEADSIEMALEISAPGKEPFEGTSPIPVVSTATNDSLNDATAIDETAGPIFATNAVASVELNEPDHAGNQGGRSLWWKWTATQNGVMRISTSGSSFDTLLAVYIGGNFADFVEVASNDDAHSTIQSEVQFAVVSDTTYFIAVDGHDGAQGDIRLNTIFTAETAPTQRPAFFRHPVDVVVRQGETILLSADVIGTPVPSFQWKRNGVDLVDNARISGSTTSQLKIENADPGDAGTYMLSATNSAGSEISLPAFVQVNGANLRPSNDDLANAHPLIGDTTQATGSNNGATAESGEPVHAGTTPHRSVWWTWTASSGGRVTADTFGSEFDTVLAIYRGNSISGITRVAENNNAPDSRQSQVSFLAEPGVQYAIVVDSAGVTEGSISLHLRPDADSGVPPAIGWQPVSVPAIEGFGVTLATAAEGTGTLNYQWWKDGAPVEGATDPFLDVDFAQVADSGDYHLVVSNSYGQTASDTVRVDVLPIIRPPNDDFANAAMVSPGGELVIARLTGATREEGEREHADGNGPTMWWNWAPSSSGLATISTDGSIGQQVEELDTVLAVYVANGQGGLTPIAENDDANASTFTSKVSFNAAVGTDYYIAVGGYSMDDSGLLLVSFPDAANNRPPTAPEILLNPISTFSSFGGGATFLVGSGGSPTPEIQWQSSSDEGETWGDLENAPNVSGVDDLVLNITSVGPNENGNIYRARLSNGSGTIHTYPAVLGVLPRPINDNFVDAIRIARGTGNTIGGSFGATIEPTEPSHAAVGEASVWWKWQATRDGRASFDTIGSNFDTVLAIYKGTALATLTLVTANDDFEDSRQSKVDFTAMAGSTYHIAVSGYYGDFGRIRLQTPTDVAASITQPPPAIVRVTAGGTVSISAGAIGNPAPSYQWQRSTDAGSTWQDLAESDGFSGTQTPTLFIRGADIASSGQQYRLQISNSIDSTTSLPATLSVEDPAVQMVNLSTRAVSLGGDSVIIPGFVISGSQSQRVLIRGVGPKLQDFGIQNFMPDPVLSVFRQGEGTPVATNDNWITQMPGTGDPGQAGDAVGAFSLQAAGSLATEDSLSAAIVLDLSPGAYSTVARDSLDQTGVGIVEIYDLDRHGSDGPKLINISNRGFVGNGAEVMIPGFVVEGTGARRYLIRAVGPKLADFGLDSQMLLADPAVSIRSGETEIAGNDDWILQTGIEANATEVEVISGEVGAFSLQAQDSLPTNDQKSAALIVWLEAGNYTVVVSSANGGTGLAIAEIYEVP